LVRLALEDGTEELSRNVDKKHTPRNILNYTAAEA
jgi:hypothetical protein